MCWYLLCGAGYSTVCCWCSCDRGSTVHQKLPYIYHHHTPYAASHHRSTWYNPRYITIYLRNPSLSSSLCISCTQVSATSGHMLVLAIRSVIQFCTRFIIFNLGNLHNVWESRLTEIDFCELAHSQNCYRPSGNTDMKISQRNNKWLWLLFDITKKTSKISCTLNALCSWWEQHMCAIYMSEKMKAGKLTRRRLIFSIYRSHERV